MRKILCFAAIMMVVACALVGCGDSGRKPVQKGDSLDIVSLLKDTYEYDIKKAEFDVRQSSGDKIKYTLIHDAGYNFASVEISVQKSQAPTGNDGDSIESNVLTRWIDGYKLVIGPVSNKDLLKIELAKLADLVYDNLCASNDLENYIINLSKTYGNVNVTVDSSQLYGYFLGKYEGYNLNYSLTLKFDSIVGGFSYAQYGDSKAASKFNEIMAEKELSADEAKKEFLRSSYIASGNEISLYYNFDEVSPDMEIPKKIIKSMSEELPKMKFIK